MFKTLLAALAATVLLVSTAYGESGVASWYDCRTPGQCSSHKIMANGQRFNPGGMTVAHKTARLGSYLRVTLTSSGRSMCFRVADRGPYARGRILDLTPASKRAIGMVGGLAHVRVSAC